MQAADALQPRTPAHHFLPGSVHSLTRMHAYTLHVLHTNAPCANSHTNGNTCDPARTLGAYSCTYTRTLGRAHVHAYALKYTYGNAKSTHSHARTCTPTHTRSDFSTISASPLNSLCGCADLSWRSRGTKRMKDKAGKILFDDEIFINWWRQGPRSNFTREVL